MHSYSFNLLDAVREAASRFTGEFTSRDVARRVKEEHPDFGLGDSQLVSNYLAVLVREGRLVRVKRPSPRDHVPGVYWNAGGLERGRYG